MRLVSTLMHLHSYFHILCIYTITCWPPFIYFPLSCTSNYSIFSLNNNFLVQPESSWIYYPWVTSKLLTGWLAKTQSPFQHWICLVSKPCLTHEILSTNYLQWLIRLKKSWGWFFVASHSKFKSLGVVEELMLYKIGPVGRYVKRHPVQSSGTGGWPILPKYIIYTMRW